MWISQYHLPPSSWSLARVPYLAEPHYKPEDKETSEGSNYRSASQSMEHPLAYGGEGGDP